MSDTTILSLAIILLALSPLLRRLQRHAGDAWLRRRKRAAARRIMAGDHVLRAPTCADETQAQDFARQMLHGLGRARGRVAHVLAEKPLAITTTEHLTAALTEIDALFSLAFAAAATTAASRADHVHATVATTAEATTTATKEHACSPE